MGHHDSPSPPPAAAPDSTSSDCAATAISRAKKSRYPVDDDGVDGDRVECSGKYCRSCSAGMIADCVALCCCPCALFNLLTLALVKVPWMVGRRCLGLGKKKKKLRESQGQNRKSKQKCKGKKKMKHCSGGGSSSQRQRRCAAEEELPAQISGYVFGFDDREEEEEEEEDCVSSAERVWLELYQVGHLGFGRVSFGGGVVQSVQGFDDMDSIYASPEDFKSLKRRDRARGAHLLEFFVERCHAIGVACEAWIKRGDPKEVICHEVKRLQPDLLVVGCRGLGPFQRVFVGTVSEFCVKHAECPVITIKRSAEETPQDPVDD